MSELLPWLIIVPCAGAVLCLLAPRAGWIGLSSAAATAGVVFGVLPQLHSQGPMRLAVGGWGAPLGIDLALDGLSMIHLLATAVLGVFISLYAWKYFQSDQQGAEARARELFWPLWLLLWGALNALFVSADLFNLYVALELVGLAAVGLVVLTKTREVLRAGLRYMLVAMVGSLAYLMGVALLYAGHGTLDLYTIGASMTPDALSQSALSLMTLGLLLKSAVFPLHFWLPPAHASATAPVSALLSALVVKGSFYILLRLWFEVFPAVVTPEFGMVLGVLGGAAIVWGSLQALRQQRLKLLIAHSTVAQLGYLLFLFPVTAAAPLMADGLPPWVLEAGKGTIYHAVSHALAKAALFLAAGIFMLAAGTDRLERMRGLAERLPLTLFSIALAGVSLMGLPPSGGFIAKWLLMHAVLGSGQWWWAPFLVVGGLLTAGYLFKLLRAAFSKPADSELQPVPRLLEVCALTLALMSIGIGMQATELLDIINIGNPFVRAGALP